MTRLVVAAVKWIAVAVVVLMVPWWIADRLEEAFRHHWWTQGVRVGPASAAFQVWFTRITRPEGPARWSWRRGWVREETLADQAPTAAGSGD